MICSTVILIYGGNYSEEGLIYWLKFNAAGIADRQEWKEIYIDVIP